jgi:hypothetical protein
MTVGELIRELADHDPTIEVYFECVSPHQGKVFRLVRQVDREWDFRDKERIVLNDFSE